MRLLIEEEEYRHLFIALRINNIVVNAMEIINSNDLRRTVLLVSDDRTDFSDLVCVLGKRYKTILFSSVPLIIYCDSVSDMEIVNGCIERGASEVIAPPLSETIVFKRIENAIRLKESRTFYEIEKMLKELPSNIYLKDNKGRYQAYMLYIQEFSGI